MGLVRGAGLQAVGPVWASCGQAMGPVWACCGQAVAKWRSSGGPRRRHAWPCIGPMRGHRRAASAWWLCALGSGFVPWGWALRLGVGLCALGSGFASWGRANNKNMKSGQDENEWQGQGVVWSGPVITVCDPCRPYLDPCWPYPDLCRIYVILSRPYPDPCRPTVTWCERVRAHDLKRVPQAKG